MQEASKILNHLKEAKAFKGEVQAPRFLTMGAFKCEQALEELILHGNTFIEEEKHVVMDPFVFNFTFVDDMELFLSILEEKGIKIHTGVIEN